MRRDWSARGFYELATSLMEAAMHFKLVWGTGVVRYSHSVSASGKDVHNVDTFQEDSS
jgi:hypothetical protein